MKQTKFEDWHVEFIAPNHYAIFHNEVNKEWVDGLGENLCFETKGEAEQYLKKVFGNGESNNVTKGEVK